MKKHLEIDVEYFINKLNETQHSIVELFAELKELSDNNEISDRAIKLLEMINRKIGQGVLILEILSTYGSQVGMELPEEIIQVARKLFNEISITTSKSIDGDKSQLEDLEDMMNTLRNSREKRRKFNSGESDEDTEKTKSSVKSGKSFLNRMKDGLSGK